MMEVKKQTEENDKGYVSSCGGVDPDLIPMLDRDGNPIKEEEETEE